MKKFLPTCLLAAVLTCSSNMALANPDPFSNVPVDDWSYTAISQMYTRGIMRDKEKAVFQSKQQVTRYEMAGIIKNLMKKKNRLDLKDQQMVNKLYAEYFDEIEKIDTIAQKPMAASVKNSGEHPTDLQVANENSMIGMMDADKDDGLTRGNYDPFKQVANNDPSYRIVKNFYQSGVLNDDKKNLFDKNQSITRYEMASIVSKLLKEKEKLSEDQKKEIDKLNEDYVTELERLGLVVQKLKQNMGEKNSHFSYGGCISLRYLHQKNIAADGSRITTRLTNKQGNQYGDPADRKWYYSLLIVKYQVDDWALVGEHEYSHRQINSAAGDDHAEFTQMYLNGPIGKFAKLRSGRFTIHSPAPFAWNNEAGIIIDDKMFGNEISFGKNTKYRIAYGHLVKTSYALDGGANYPNYLQASVEFPITNKDRFAIVRHQVTGNDSLSSTITVNNESLEINEFVYGKKFDRNLSMLVNYAKSDTETLNTSKQVSLFYKRVEGGKTNSFGLWTRYGDLQRNSILTGNVFGKTSGKPSRGWDFGLKYQVGPKIGWETEFATMKSTEDAQHDKYYKSYLTFSF